MFGTLNIDKPQGITSRDAVNRIQRIVRPVKVGHAGTLDPLASGVLVVCLGTATRLVEYVQRMPKRYRATFLLGRESDTEDIEGMVTEIENASTPSLARIESTLPRFVGSIEQRPPVYSALKIRGRRACDLARAGQTVDLQPRRVMIYDLAVVAYEYPELTLDVRCGSGTYVRSLGRDVASALGTAAVMSALQRTAIGNYRLEHACCLENLNADTLPSHVLPASLTVASLPQLELSASELHRISRGQSISVSLDESAEAAAAFDVNGELRAILVRRQGGWGPSRYFGA